MSWNTQSSELNIPVYHSYRWSKISKKSLLFLFLEFVTTSLPLKLCLQFWAKLIRPITVWTQSNFFFHLLTPLTPPAHVLYVPATLNFSLDLNTPPFPLPVACTFLSDGKPLVPTLDLPLPKALLLLVKALFILQNLIQMSSLGPLFFLLLKHFHHYILICVILWPFPAFCLALTEFLASRNGRDSALVCIQSHLTQHPSHKELSMPCAWTWICVCLHMCDKGILQFWNK